ncbi:pyruvate, water dikinase regulatory protein [Aliibacillus thermotolerans]|mgnify:FL=1|uniref:Putative pyruvate, phosphate dikinase regulatory protein n=1 Tax=Aliibacillus thermotolerans TaxID=1834418 RepID=A0ABW0UBM9_9BACI|nr:pyruvate, water dikinase regulatory protein [Aliibacillus thermotolerans]MDA3130729.1 pyruvate, phosphate dikinase/phosphoenolpyruvate synthase regulator [Aliibacillus thermotolerans]
MEERPIVYVVSDSVGETAELVVKAAASQFGEQEIEIRRIPYVEDEHTIDEVINLAKEMNAFIAFTLVIPEKNYYLRKKAEEAGVETVDIIGPMLNKMIRLTGLEPKYEPGLVYRLDEDYFRKVEAIEFAVKYDDGRDPRGITRADIVLIGVSRTSKTPLSQYLAHKRLKVANVPLVPEVDPPEELYRIPPEKCIGLRISPEKLNEIRTERLKSLGLKAEANYAKLERIKEELAYSEKIMKDIGCTVIDVSNKAVEETANLIFNMFQKGLK